MENNHENDAETQSAAETARKLVSMDKLIRKLAMMSIDWTPEELDQRINWENAERFSADDIKYMRILLGDLDHLADQALLHERYIQMRRVKPEERFRFWTEKVEPVEAKKEKREREIKNQFGGLIFYADPWRYVSPWPL